MLQQITNTIAEYPKPQIVLASIGALAATFFVASKLTSTNKKPKLTVKNPKSDVVYLFAFLGLKDEHYSPFCSKIEAYLKFSKIPYELMRGSPNNSPTKKLPYIEINGELIYDSTFIIEYLKKKIR